MRKSTTSARMMKKRSRGIPKPLFQSVQFPALITTSNTLCQVGRDSTCFLRTPYLLFRSFLILSCSLSAVTRLGHVCIEYMDSVSICILSCFLSHWNSHCLSEVRPVSLPLGQLKHLILTQMWLQQSINSSELCVRFMGKWSAHRSSICTEMCLNKGCLFQGLSSGLTTFCKNMIRKEICSCHVALMSLVALQAAEFGLTDCHTIHENCFHFHCWDIHCGVLIKKHVSQFSCSEVKQAVFRCSDVNWSLVCGKRRWR